MKLLTLLGSIVRQQMDPITIRQSVLSAPLGALASTLAYKHFFEEPATCDGTVFTVPTMGAILGLLIWYCWSSLLKAFVSRSAWVPVKPDPREPK
jgi:hypothetical protein